MSRQRAFLWGMLASFLVGTQHCASLWGILELLGQTTSEVDTVLLLTAQTSPLIEWEVMDISRCALLVKYVKMLESKKKKWLKSPLIESHHLSCTNEAKTTF